MKFYPSNTISNEQDSAITYLICTTGSTTSTKSANYSNEVLPGSAAFYLFEGATVSVLFTHANRVSNPQLNVQNTGNFPIIGLEGTVINTDSQYASWSDNAIKTFTFSKAIISNGAWIMHDAPQTLKHALYRPTNTVPIGGTYWNGLIHNGGQTIDIQVNLPYAISDGTEGIVAVNDVCFVGTNGEDTYTANTRLYTPDDPSGLNLNVELSNSWSTRKNRIIIDYKLGSIIFSVPCTFPKQNYPVLVWFKAATDGPDPSTGTIIKFGAGQPG